MCMCHQLQGSEIHHVSARKLILNKLISLRWTIFGQYRLKQLHETIATVHSFGIKA